jgi:hypothetical protein
MLTVGTFTEGEFTTSARQEDTENVTLFEAAPRGGGRMSSEEKKGFTITHLALTVYDRGRVVMKNNVGDIFVGSLGEEG